MKGYKAFKKGLICRDKQYKENTTFEEDTVKICEKGMHFCKNPLDCLEYYPLIDENGEFMEFAEVEALEEPVTDDNKKFATKKLHIGEKLSLDDYIKASVDFIFENCKEDEKATDDYLNLAASGVSSNLAASGSKSSLAAAGENSSLVSTGAYSCSVAAGENSSLVASGAHSSLAAAGRFSSLAASGLDSSLTASGRNSSLAAAGRFSSLAVTGAFSSLTAGENSIVAGIGYKNRAKAAKDSWIVLAEYDKDGYTPICVKAAQVDGEKIKANTWYELKGGEFTETT